ncbi:MAG TPA: HEAT repeat domain-containing protein [Terriglobia bacterium]|nr:HEAT repeat domain-containing protein [Terriglobia bacterium]
MGWEVDAFLGRLDALLGWKDLLPATVIFPLQDGVGLVPATGGFLQNLQALRLTSPPSSEDALVSAWGAKASKDCTIAYFSLFEFGDEGDASGSAFASVWTNQQAIPPCSVNTALQLLGVKATSGLDEFGTVGLGRYHKTDTWAAAAILNGIVEQASNRVEGLLHGLAYPEHPGVRVLAAGELGAMGADAVAAIPHFVELAKSDPDYSVRLRAISAMQSIGPASVPSLRALLAPGQLQHQDKDRWCVIMALGRLGAAAAPAKAELVTILRTEPDHDQRSQAAQALGQIGTDARVAIPALIEALRDPHHSVRFHAIRALGHTDPDRSLVIPALMPLLHDKYNLAAEVAADLLIKLGGGRAMVDELIKELQTAADFKLRVAAIVSLGKCGNDAEIAVTTLVESLGDENIYVPNQSAVALGRIGSAARPAVPALLKALWDKDKRVAESATEAMGLIGSAEVAVRELVHMLKTAKSPRRRGTAAECLGKLGASAQIAVPALIEACHDAQLEVGILATEALGRMGPAAHEAVPALRELIKDSQKRNETIQEIYKNIPNAAIESLGRMGPVATAATPELIAVLRESPSGRRQGGAAKALGRIGKAAEAAIPALIEALGDKSPDVSLPAAEALGCMGPAARVAVPALRESLKSKNKYLVEYARKALELIQAE